MRALLLCLAGFACFVLALAACDPAGTSGGPGGDLFNSFPTGEWRWIGPTAENPGRDLGLRCRDGSATGFGVRLGSEREKLLIFLPGGGACYSTRTCDGDPTDSTNTGNPSSFSEASFDAYVAERGNAGVFRDTSLNPFHNWSVVFVPYCTGDVHVGYRPGGGNDSLGPQEFVGLRNLQVILDTLFDRGAGRLDTVALAGFSAGGFGAVGAYGAVAERFGDVPVHAINDAGPILRDDNVFKPALEAVWRDLWGLDSALAACGPACNRTDEQTGTTVGVENAMPHYAATYPGRGFGLISFMEDCNIRKQYCFTNPACGPESACSPSDRPRVPADDYRAALLDLRQSLDATPNAVTFYRRGRGHSSLLADDFYEIASDGVFLYAWIEELLRGRAADVGP